MKSFLFLLSIAPLVLCEEKYTTKYDNVDLDEIISSERLLNGYVKCLLDEGPCTPDGKELKGNIPDAIQNDCKKCTERQKQGSDKVMGFIIDHRPDDWVRLEKKYNSDGSYKKKYLAKKAEKHGGAKPITSDEKEDVDDKKEETE